MRAVLDVAGKAAGTPSSDPVSSRGSHVRPSFLLSSTAVSARDDVLKEAFCQRATSNGLTAVVHASPVRSPW